MRCPKCGFISFDDLVACAKCHLPLMDKNALPFEGTAIRAQHAICLRAVAMEPGEPELMPAEEQDTADDVYRELAAESLEAGLTGGAGAGEEEFDLFLAEPEDEGKEESPMVGTEEEIPAIDLSGFGAEEAAEELPAAGESPEGRGDSEAEELEFDLAADEEEEEIGLMAEGESEEIDLASPGAAANLDGIDLSGLMGGEETGPVAETTAVSVYDLSDLMTAEGDADDVLALDAGDHADREQPVEEALLDLTFDGMGEDTAADSLEMEFDIDNDLAGEELDLNLELEEESEEGPATLKTQVSSSGLSLENEEDA